MTQICRPARYPILAVGLHFTAASMATAVLPIAAGVTHTGCRRSNNEDAFLVDIEAGLFVVCDGMGGHDFGEIAARLAVEELRAAISLDAAGRSRTGGPAAFDPHFPDLEAAVTRAHDRVRVESEIRDLPMHMGTTLVAAVVRGGRLQLASVGDSRAYLISPLEYRQLTRDHTVARLYAQAGLISEDAVAGHPMRGVLVRCLGAPDGCEADTLEIALQPGERLLLCSDGLSEMVELEEIVDIVRGGREPEGIAQALVAAALAGGGKDNVTVVVVEPHWTG